MAEPKPKIRAKLTGKFAGYKKTVKGAPARSKKGALRNLQKALEAPDWGGRG